MKLFEAAKTVHITDVWEKITGKKVKKTRKGAMVSCPFHNDRKPSMALYDDNNTFFCFGCHRQGSSIDLAMHLLNLDNKAAAIWICENFGVEYDAPRVSSVAVPAAPEEDRLPADILLKNNLRLAMYFRGCLEKAPDPKFFDKRGVGSLAEEFLFGYCPKGVIFTKDAKLAVKCGVGNDRGECVFAGRYILPIKDYHGNIIGFIGRLPDREVDDSHPKYLISENSPIFRKRDVFYNAGALLDRDSKEIIVVEGAFDALSYIAAGVRNVVSPLGCSLSDRHLDILRKIPDRTVVLGFDRDEAGERATRSAIRYMKDLRVSVLTADYRNQKDANSLLLAEGASYLAGAVSSVPAPEFLIAEAAPKLKTVDGQEALWVAVASSIGSREAAYQDRYPINKAYTPVAFNRFWSEFDKAIPAI